MDENCLLWDCPTIRLIDGRPVWDENLPHYTHVADELLDNYPDARREIETRYRILNRCPLMPEAVHAELLGR